MGVKLYSILIRKLCSPPISRLLFTSVTLVILQLYPTLSEINSTLKKKETSILKQKVKIKTVLSRPHITINDLLVCKALKHYLDKENPSSEAVEQAEIEIKYGGYLNKEKESAAKLRRLENIKITEGFEFNKLHSISTEGREKLKTIRPKTIGQAARISGVSPSDINVLLIYLGR